MAPLGAPGGPAYMPLRALHVCPRGAPAYMPPGLLNMCSPQLGAHPPPGPPHICPWCPGIYIFRGACAYALRGPRASPPEPLHTCPQVPCTYVPGSWVRGPPQGARQVPVPPRVRPSLGGFPPGALWGCHTPTLAKKAQKGSQNCQKKNKVVPDSPPNCPNMRPRKPKRVPRSAKIPPPISNKIGFVLWKNTPCS